MSKLRKTDTMLDTAKMKEIREARKLTMEQAAVAAKIGTRQRWYSIESGINTNIELGTLNAIAAALGVNAKELLK